MAMLAEPRQRKRYNLTPRGKALYEDDSRFGTKMLEKMGWSKGKGLGANENGSKDFVRVRMRNTNEGLGFEDRDDHWTVHEQSFTGLLKQLNGEESEKEGSNSDVEETATVGFGFKVEPTKLKKEKLKEKFSGESLEEKSKRSKARVHYKKFTKGKDLAQYSEKDLANIFGRKVIEEQQANGIYQQFTAVNAVESDQEETTKENPEVKENFAGVQTISTGLSVSDYFKQKMEEMKYKRKNIISNAVAMEKEPEVEKLLEVDEKQTKSKKKKRKLEEEQEAIVASEQQETRNKKISNILEEKAEVLEIVDKTEKKKKKKKNKAEERCEGNALENPVSKNKDMPSEELLLKINEVECVEDASKKSKKKRKIIHDEVETISATEEVTKKKANKKRKNVAVVEVLEEKCDKTKANIENSNKSNKVITKSSKKKSKKDVSAIDFKEATLDDLIAKFNSYNTYTISSFCAEKFRHVDLENFLDSTLAQIDGYSYGDDMQLNIKTIKGDEDRITKLWNCTINKYSNAQPKKSFYEYAKQARAAYKTKKKLPRFKVKTWKRKNAFQPI